MSKLAIDSWFSKTKKWLNSNAEALVSGYEEGDALSILICKTNGRSYPRHPFDESIALLDALMVVEGSEHDDDYRRIACYIKDGLDCANGASEEMKHFYEEVAERAKTASGYGEGLGRRFRRYGVEDEYGENASGAKIVLEMTTYLFALKRPFKSDRPYWNDADFDKFTAALRVFAFGMRSDTNGEIYAEARSFMASLRGDCPVGYPSLFLGVGSRGVFPTRKRNGKPIVKNHSLAQLLFLGEVDNSQINRIIEGTASRGPDKPPTKTGLSLMGFREPLDIAIRIYDSFGDLEFDSDGICVEALITYLRKREPEAFTEEDLKILRSSEQRLQLLTHVVLLGLGRFSFQDEGAGSYIYKRFGDESVLQNTGPAKETQPASSEGLDLNVPILALFKEDGGAEKGFFLPAGLAAWSRERSKPQVRRVLVSLRDDWPAVAKFSSDGMEVGANKQYDYDYSGCSWVSLGRKRPIPQFEVNECDNALASLVKGSAKDGHGALLLPAATMSDKPVKITVAFEASIPEELARSWLVIHSAVEEFNFSRACLMVRSSHDDSGLWTVENASEGDVPVWILESLGAEDRRRKDHYPIGSLKRLDKGASQHFSPQDCFILFGKRDWVSIEDFSHIGVLSFCESSSFSITLKARFYFGVNLTYR